MARIRYLEESDLAAEDRPLLARGLNLYRALTHSPGAARAFEHFAKFLRYESKLDPRLRELAILQVGYLAGAAYSFYGHIGFVSRQFGVSDEDIHHVIAETKGEESPLDPLARTVLRAAREMTSDFTISDQTFAALRCELDDTQLTDLVATISFYNAAVRYIKTMQIDIEADRIEEYEAHRKRFVLPGH